MTNMPAYAELDEEDGMLLLLFTTKEARDGYAANPGPDTAILAIGDYGYDPVETGGAPYWVRALTVSPTVPAHKCLGCDTPTGRGSWFCETCARDPGACRPDRHETSRTPTRQDQGDNVTTTAYEAVGVLYRHRHSLPADILRSLQSIYTCASAARYGQPYEKGWLDDTEDFVGHDVAGCECGWTGDAPHGVDHDLPTHTACVPADAPAV